YAVERKIEPFYKGGKVQVLAQGSRVLDQTGQHLFCVCGTRVNILDVASGTMLQSLEQVRAGEGQGKGLEDQEDITAFDLSPDDKVYGTGTRAADTSIRVWSLQEQSCLAMLTAHYSAVTSLTFSADGHTMLSSGRDKICIVWDLQSLQATRTVPVVTADHNLLLYEARSLQLQKQFAGYSEEVLDVRFLGPEDSHVVVASNSPCLKVFELQTSACQILHGHTDIVLALDVFRKGWLFVSCAKVKHHERWGGQGPGSGSPAQPLDQSICVWRMNKAGKVACVAQGSGHTHSRFRAGVRGVMEAEAGFALLSESPAQECGLEDRGWGIPRCYCRRFLRSDLKVVWLKGEGGVRPGTMTLSSVQGERVLFRPGAPIAGTKSPGLTALRAGSADSSGSRWSQRCSGGGTLVHIPGQSFWFGPGSDRPELWCAADRSGQGSVGVSLSPKSGLRLKETFLVTGSQDCTVKLWPLPEALPSKSTGPDGGPFSPMDQVLATASADGTVKLWALQDFSCLKDVTEAEQAEEQAKREEQVVKQQELDNLLHEKRYLRALGLAISLDRPHTVLTVIQAIQRDPESCEKLEATVLQLRRDQKEALLRFCVTWNTNSRHCHEAQAVLGVLLRHEAPEELLAY
ncbi:hypothetical protein E2I00_009235, partial [Balaenoptera physalus]